jgi:hypothetical protein
MIREIGHIKAYLPEDLWHLAQQIRWFSVRFFRINPQTGQRYRRVVGEAAPLRRRRYHLAHQQHF